MKVLVVFPQMRLLAWMLLPPPDDELELIRACQNVVGGFIEMALRLPNGDAVASIGTRPRRTASSGCRVRRSGCRVRA
jgi:hypothetical protein